MGGRRALLAAAVLLAARRAAAQALATPLDLPDLPPAGGLRLLGGLQLDAGVIGFGGLSGLALAPDLTLTAVSDTGHWLTARLLLAGDRPIGIGDLRTGPLREVTGQPLPGTRAGDAEAVLRTPDGIWLVAFERLHRIRAYRALDGAALLVPEPPGLNLAPGNQGLEALAMLADGRLLAITEGLAVPDAPGLMRAWIGRPGPWQAIAYRPEPGFRPVDAAGLPDGGALVLERYFSLLGGFEGRLVRLSPAALQQPVLQGDEILRLASPLPTDNYEAVAVTRWQGRTLIALLSDDNQSVLQRSLLLLFELAG
jgi:hypothetical protein